MNFPSNDPSSAKLKAMSFVLLILLLSGSCSDSTFVPPAKLTTLSSSISSAIQLVVVSPEGAAAGFNIRGSQLTLKQAITVSQTVYATANVTQDAVDKANTDLATAVALFKSQKVAGVDLPNLAGQWTFDEVSDSGEGAVVKDYSGKGRDGVVKIGHVTWGRGTPTLGTDRYGVWGKCLHFNAGANIEIPYLSDLNGSNLTISLWTRPDENITDNQYLISLNRFNCYKLSLNNGSDGVPKATLSVRTAEDPGATINENNGSALTRNTWRHIVVTFGDGHIRFYINGALVNDVARAGTVVKQTPGINLVIGQDLPTDKYSTEVASPFYVFNGGFFIGYIDEVRVYKSVLTADQVTAIYNIEKP